MWIVTMFDLPTDTRRAQRAYNDFRKFLLNDGFFMMQFSVYARHCASEENARVHRKRIYGFLPPEGEVRVLSITDKQYERMQIYYGKMRKKAEKAPEQITFF